MSRLDDDLRVMLRERAADISAAPADLSPMPGPGSGRGHGPGGDRGTELLGGRPEHRPGPSWWQVAAAAALVVLIVGAGVAIRAATGDRRLAPTVSVLGQDSCATELPPSWQQVEAGSTAYVGFRPSGVTSDGAVVGAVPAAATTPGTLGLDVEAVAPGSSRVRQLASFVRTTSDGLAWGLQVEGTTVLVVLSSNGQRAPAEIDVLDARTGAVHSLAAGAGAELGQAYLSGGTVYWTESATSSPTVRVHEYDVATGTSRVVAAGRGALLRWSAAGVWWSGDAAPVDRPEPLPGAVAMATQSATARGWLTTDGTSYAWATGTAIGWWAPGRSTVVSTRVAVTAVLAVAGPYVVFDPAGGPAPPRILDTRTGAVAPLATAGSYFGHDATLVTDAPLVAPVPAAGELVRLDTGLLPELRC